jgi:ribosomal 30S subunit maturation factor RimM
MEWQTKYDPKMGEVTIVVQFGMTEIGVLEENVGTPDDFLVPYIEQAEADLQNDWMPDAED